MRKAAVQRNDVVAFMVLAVVSSGFVSHVKVHVNFCKLNVRVFDVEFLCYSISFEAFVDCMMIYLFFVSLFVRLAAHLSPCQNSYEILKR